MHQEFPKLMFGRGTLTRVVHDADDQDRAENDGFSTTPGDAHRLKHRAEGPAFSASVEPLTEAHIPLIVDQVTEAVFDRLKGMAVAATEGEAYRDAIEAVRGEFADHLAALKDDLLGGIAALIAPAPAAPAGKRG